jgi:hypothetical protein
MRQYNISETGKAIVYGTYQAYLKSTPTTVATHLQAAKAGNFVLGVKLVRGAYLGSDPRHLIWATKAETDDAYNDIAASLMTKRWGRTLKPITSDAEFPEVNLVLAGHNQMSASKAIELRVEQARKGDKRIDLVYAQLQGMADEVSCELLQAGASEPSPPAPSAVKEWAKEVPNVYKYLVWGTIGECMKYLLRRAQENKDAIQRTKQGRIAMAAELRRRVLGTG